MSARVLVVDDDLITLDILSRELEKQGLTVMTAEDGKAALEEIKHKAPDLVVSDLQMPKMNGIELLNAIKRDGLDTTVIMVTAFGTVDKAVEAMKLGAFDFITKPFDLEHINIVVSKALERKRLEEEVNYLRGELQTSKEIVTTGAGKMKAVLESARRVAASDSAVLLLGESGTGKELLARAIHDWSSRRDKAFVTVNCVALSEQLLESELFGHEKGAFTGADSQKKGKAELADGGTIFLDEISDIKPELQAKLLRFLEEREFDRIGGTAPIKVDIRLITATNQNLSEKVADGKFREDLYFRLNVIPIALPPLRERKGDIEKLASYFLERYKMETKKDVKRISDPAMKLLKRYYWPGNVRELKNVIEGAVVLSESEEIHPNDLSIQFAGAPHRSSGGPPATPSGGILPFQKAVDESKKAIILNALAETGGSQVDAAALLDLNPTYLSKLIKDLGIRKRPLKK